MYLLKCTSSDAAPLEETNMAMIPEFKERFGVLPGLSDYILGSTVPIVATTLGAKIIEKYFILDRSIGGSDASFSMNEVEFTATVKAVREAEQAVGEVSYEHTEKQMEGKDFSRSLYVVKDIKKGEVNTEDNVKSISPGFGMHPNDFHRMNGQVASRDIRFGERSTFHIIDNNKNFLIL